jgi:hypothetical protein
MVMMMMFVASGEPDERACVLNALVFGGIKPIILQNSLETSSPAVHVGSFWSGLIALKRNEPPPTIFQIDLRPSQRCMRPARPSRPWRTGLVTGIVISPHVRDCPCCSATVLGVGLRSCGCDAAVMVHTPCHFTMLHDCITLHGDIGCHVLRWYNRGHMHSTARVDGNRVTLWPHACSPLTRDPCHDLPLSIDECVWDGVFCCVHSLTTNTSFDDRECTAQ